MSVDDSRFRLRAGCVLVFTAILFFARLGARALWSSEFRWAEIAREMLVTHNYFWPTINGHVYYDKPLGSYWLVLFSTPFTGGLNEAATRVPCAIAGILAVALLMLLVRRLYDARTAILSGVILATSFSFVFFSRHASADVETLTGELAALLLFNHYEDRGGGIWVVGLWLIMAATSLTKGLLGFVLPILVIGAYSCLRDGWAQLFEEISRGSLIDRIQRLIDRNRWFFNWYTVAGIAVGGFVYYLPFEISARMMGTQKGLAMVYRENVVRFFHPFDHRGPIYLYVYVIFGLMAPWSALLPAALVETHSVRHAGAEPARADRFALVYFWATFIFFTLSGSRRSYYILPILPAAAILVARTLAYRGGELRSMIARRLLTVGFVIVAFIAVASIIALIPAWAILPSPYDALPDLPAKPAFIVFWIVSVAAVIYAIRKFEFLPHRRFSRRHRISRDVLHLRLRDAGGRGLSRREAFRLRGAEHARRFHRPSRAVQDRGPAVLSQSAEAPARVRQKAGARGRDRKGRREMDDRPPSRHAEARHSNHGRAERGVLSVGGRRQLPKQSSAGPPRQLTQNNFFN